MAVQLIKELSVLLDNYEKGTENQQRAVYKNQVKQFITEHFENLNKTHSCERLKAIAECDVLIPFKWRWFF